MEKFIKVMVGAYALYAFPCVKLLRWLIRVTGKPSTFFSRGAVWFTLVAWASELVLDVVSDRDFWLFNGVVSCLIAPLLAVWALNRIKKVENHIKSGQTTFPLAEVELIQLIVQGLIYLMLGITSLPTLWEEADTFPIRCLGIVICSAWIPWGQGGGKSAWARAKEKIKNWAKSLAPAPVPIPVRN